MPRVTTAPSGAFFDGSGTDHRFRKAVMGDITEEHCAICGTTVPANAQFCIECGAEVPFNSAGRSDRPTQVDERGAGRHALLETLRQATQGKYDVVSEAGRGGMASVFLAHDIALDRKVAIKVFTPDVIGSGATVRERFQREARTAASLSHPHIIPIYAVQQSERVMYFVMKYVEGRSLESVLREEGSLPVPMVMTILTQVGSALDYAHRKGVIHRDIKPGNIMLDQEGYAIVMDFGIAKVAESEGLTITGSTVGTPAYMSPEQCLGMGVTGASDQYAMGVVAYQMLAGALPFEGSSAMTVMYKHTHEPPRHIAELSTEVPRPLANAVMRMLAKTPTDRFPDMASLAEAFGSLHEDEGDMRTKMISLARSKEKILSATHPGGNDATTVRDFGPDSQTVQLASTPVTPIPETKPRKKRAVWIIPTAAVAAAIIFLVSPVGLGSGSDDEREADATLQNETVGIPPHSEGVIPSSAADIEIDPVLVTVQVGETLRINATAFDSAGAQMPNLDLVWQSSDEDITTVSTGGVITGIAAGTTTVIVRAPGHTTSIPVIVEARPPVETGAERPTRAAVASVEVTPASPDLVPGENVSLTVTPRDAAGRVLTGRTVQWRTSDPTTIEVSDGTITAHKSGNAVITVVVDGRAASVPVNVSDAPVATISLSRGEAALLVGETVLVSASAFDTEGNTVDRVPTWRSDDPSVASVSPIGTITALSQGSTKIWAELEGRSASMSVNVGPVPDAGPPPPDPAADRAQILDVIDAYRAAIQSEDLSAIRSVFPDIPQTTADRFTQFFETVTDLVVTLAVRDLQLSGDVASVIAEGSYEFRLDGSARQSDIALTLRLARAGRVWRVTEILQ